MAYDPAMLNEIRNIVHPLYSSVPSPELDRKQLLKKIKITTADLPRPPLRWRGQPSTVNATISTTGKYDNNNTNNGCDGDGDILPHPVISHAHGKGCVYSDKPDIVVKSAEFVKTIDTFARMRLKNLTRLLDAGITYVDDDLKVACTRRDQTSTPPSTTSTAALTTSASLASTLETESELLDFDTNTTATSFTSASSRGGEKEDADVDVDVDMGSISLTRLFARLAANEVTDKMRSEQMRLQACLATSSLAKGLYWKRCNGVYRNALDDELLPATASASASASVSVSATTSTTTTTTSDCDSAGKGKAIMTEDKEEANVPVDDGHHHGGAQTLSGYGYAVLASPERARARARPQFRPASRIVDTKSQASVSVNGRDLSPGSSSIGIGTPPPLSAPKSTSTSSQVSSISSTPSQPPPHGCETGSEELERKQGDYEEDHDDSEFSMIHLVRTNPETFTFTSSILMNREAMVRSGAVDDDDLCLTGWGYNRLERRVKGSMN
jgi:hypothetical protein